MASSPADASPASDAPWSDRDRARIIDVFQSRRISKTPYSAAIGMGEWLADRLVRVGGFMLDDAGDGLVFAPGRRAYAYDCHGYLGSGTLRVASDGITHELVIDRPVSSSPSPPCDPANLVFMLAAKLGTHQSLVTAADARRAYAAVPPAIREWAAERADYYREPAPQRPEAWADVDGDGTIDIVSIVGRCKLDDYTCTLLLARIGERWSIVGDQLPM
ncbi:MAG TPA: hypothetical protein VFQ53_03425 [Kofleriaceae bacterium]|nr:hypothetical protein [Kofleriaceae bacterium]